MDAITIFRCPYMNLYPLIKPIGQLLLLILPGLSYGQAQEIAVLPTSLTPGQIDTFGRPFDPMPTTLLGVVSPAVQGGFDEAERGYAIHGFSLAAWRTPDEDTLHQSPMHIWRTASLDANFLADIPAYSLLQITGYKSQDHPRLIMTSGSILRIAPADLLRAQAQLRTPAYLETEAFGNFVLDPTINWYEKTLDWGDTPIQVMLEPNAQEEVTDHLSTLTTLLQDRETWEQRIRRQITNDLLDLKNNTWLRDGEAPLNEETFSRSFRLYALIIREGGVFTFWFYDQGLFWGHDVRVWGNLQAGPQGASMSG